MRQVTSVTAQAWDDTFFSSVWAAQTATITVDDTTDIYDWSTPAGFTGLVIDDPADSSGPFAGYGGYTVRLIKN